MNDELDLNDICRRLLQEHKNINERDLKIYLDKKLFGSQNTETLQKNMYDCLTYVNHVLGYVLLEIIYEMSMESNVFIYSDIDETLEFLYDSLSPMTKLA